MRRFRWIRGAVVLGLAGALVGVVPDGVSAVPALARCRATAFVTNLLSDTVSAIDVPTRTKHSPDIALGQGPFGVASTPDGKTAFVTNLRSGTVSTIDVKTRKKHPTDIPVGAHPKGVAVTPDGKTAFVTNANLVGEQVGDLGSTVSTIDVKTRTKHPTDIAVGTEPLRVAITPDGKTAFVVQASSLATVDVKTRTKDPTDIPPGGPTSRPSSRDSGNGTRRGQPRSTSATTQGGNLAVTPDGNTVFVAAGQADGVLTVDVKNRTIDGPLIAAGGGPIGIAITTDGNTAFVTNTRSATVSTIDVKTRTKDPTDIPVGTVPNQVAITPCRR